MTIYCLEEFKVQWEKMLSKRPYKSLEKDLVKYFYDKTPQELSSGVRLNHSTDSPFIKKRLGGRGGLRLYYLLLIHKGNLYLMFVHPKTGPMGASNITDASKAVLYRRTLECIKSKDLYEVNLHPERGKISFTQC